ncbi:MAG: hypothetical protein JNK87_21515 [Bryobacterales bacterium]|nr:hypothetical protein [Bryobacterales bacterium]
MKKRGIGRLHSPGLLRRFLERLRGREQTLVRGPREWPLLLLSYPPKGRAVAAEIGDAWLHTLPALRSAVAVSYREMLRGLPPMVVVILRDRNVCSCLGHHHPSGTESRLTRRLAADSGGTVGEIDLAWEAIRQWQPNPLSALAAAVAEPSFNRLQFRTAMLTVLLHELEHLAHPDHREAAVRGTSDGFYREVLNELLGEEGASARYGMQPAPSLP